MKLKIAITFLSFLVTATLTVSTSAQAKSCPLDLSVEQFQANPNADAIPIENATATVTNAEGKITKAGLFEGTPSFAELTEGKYTLIVAKPGFKRTFKQITIDCDGLAEDGSVSEVIFLQKGSAKQIYKQKNLTATVVNEEPKAETQTINQNKQTENQTPKVIDEGVINGKASNLVKPEYPAAARAVRASGAVNVQVTIDELGNVVLAAALSGHPLLRAAAVQAARASTFSPTILSGQRVKITGVIVYNFATQ